MAKMIWGHGKGLDMRVPSQAGMHFPQAAFLVEARILMF